MYHPAYSLLLCECASQLCDAGNGTQQARVSRESETPSLPHFALGFFAPTLVPLLDEAAPLLAGTALPFPLAPAPPVAACLGGASTERFLCPCFAHSSSNRARSLVKSAVSQQPKTSCCVRVPSPRQSGPQGKGAAKRRTLDRPSAVILGLETPKARRARKRGSSRTPQTPMTNAICFSEKGASNLGSKASLERVLQNWERGRQRGAQTGQRREGELSSCHTRRRAPSARRQSRGRALARSLRGRQVVSLPPRQAVLEQGPGKHAHLPPLTKSTTERSLLTSASSRSCSCWKSWSASSSMSSSSCGSSLSTK